MCAHSDLTSAVHISDDCLPLQRAHAVLLGAQFSLTRHGLCIPPLYIRRICPHACSKGYPDRSGVDRSGAPSCW